MRVTCVMAVMLVATLALAAAAATVRPNPMFSDGAVLQRGISVPVWGTANDGEKITVSFADQKVSTTAKNGKWMVRLAPLSVGGPRVMTISGDNTIEIKDILVGDVWVCSGQSNMQWSLAGTANAKEDIAKSLDSHLRLLQVPMLTADSPSSEVPVKWEKCRPGKVNDFTAVGYFFGRDLRKALNVPIGLINSSWGGTYAQTWMTREGFESNPALRHILTDPIAKDGPNRPTVLYNGMIAPLQPYAIKGAIWYQGESNAGGAYEYRTLFPAMIESWRKSWGQGDFTFLFVQIAPFMKIATEPEESNWAELREAQLLTSQHCPNTGMAVITDYGSPDDIHPKQKEPVGARLALAARAVAYSEDIIYRGPTYKGMKVKGDSIALYFDSVGGGLVAKGGELTGFTIAGADRKFYNAEAKIVGKSVVVRSASVAKPVAVRYGWANCPVVNLFNVEDLPATPFRTDDFPITTGPK